MTNLKEQLLSSNISLGTYALVTYDGATYPVWFTKYQTEDGDWFLESPCELYKISEVSEPVEQWTIEYVADILDEDVGVKEYIKQYILPMIVNGVLYEIENFQCAPYLPKEVDDLKLITERECLEYMLQQS